MQRHRRAHWHRLQRPRGQRYVAGRQSDHLVPMQQAGVDPVGQRGEHAELERGTNRHGVVRRLGVERRAIAGHEVGNAAPEPVEGPDHILGGREILRRRMQQQRGDPPVGVEPDIDPHLVRRRMHDEARAVGLDRQWWPDRCPRLGEHRQQLLDRHLREEGGREHLGGDGILPEELEQDHLPIGEVGREGWSHQAGQRQQEQADDRQAAVHGVSIG